MWNAAKAVLRGKYIALNAYYRKQEGFKMNDLSFFFFKKLEKEEHIIHKVRRRNKMINISRN